MYGRATNLAKKAVSEMNKQKLKELVRKSLMNEADIETMADKIGGEEELSLASNLLDDFESKLKSHDWYYMMSDDNRAYSNGSAEESELKKIARQLSDMGYGGDAAKIFNQYNVFKNTSFSSFIAPPEPFIPMYKRKEMGLDETEFSKEFDNDPALKGSQKKLPDALQKAIIKKEKGVKEDIDLGHEDNEPHMIKGELYQIGKYAMDLYAILEELEEKGGEYDFPAWWQSKITTAKNMMSGAKHYLDFELKEPAIDAAVDALTGEEPHMGEPEAPMMENIDKDEMLAARLYKIKNQVQPAFYQKVRMMINNGDLEKAEEFILRMEPVAAKKDTEFAAMKNQLDFLGEKKLTKDELKEIIKNSIKEGDIDEGFFDRMKANIKGITAKTSTTFDNLKAFAKGDKEAIKNPKLAQNMAKLQQKAKTLDTELADVMKDMATLFPKDVMSTTPEEFQTVLNQYTGMLDAVKTLNTQISKGEFKPTTASSSKSTPPPLNTPPPATSTSTTTRPSASVADKLVSQPKKPEATTSKPPLKTPTAKTSTSGKTYNYKGKDYSVQTDKDGDYIMVGGTKIAVQPKFDPNKGVKPEDKKTTNSSPARDEKGRFTSTKKVAEIITKKIKSK